MLSDEVIEKVIERLITRIENGNEYILEQIGKSIKKVGTLNSSTANKIIQVFRYGGDYDKIVKKISEVTNLNVKEIYKIFEEVAKNDYAFARQFYEYRNKKYIPWEENDILQNQVKAIADVTIKEYRNIMRTLAFSKKVNGKVVYTELSKAYQNIMDEAILNIAQGKDTFQNQMYKSIKELGESGIRTIDFESGRSMRLDSAVRMHLKAGIRNLHNEIQKNIGEEFGADGIEVSVHLNPAPDHEKVQGRQFSNEEFDNFQNDRRAISYDGIVFEAEFNGRDRRSISQYNCYHNVFSIILGVNKPQYSNKELQEIIENNNKGFEFDGQHYTNYEGTQLQRQIELAIRKEKDKQILARASGEDDLVGESQKKITQLTRKYRELSVASGLPTKMDRMRVSGYKRVAIKK